MIRCTLEVSDDASELYKIFQSETLERSERAHCKITKKKSLVFEIEAKDSTSMKAFTNSILKVIQTYKKISGVK